MTAVLGPARLVPTLAVVVRHARRPAGVRRRPSPLTARKSFRCRRVMDFAEARSFQNCGTGAACARPDRHHKDRQPIRPSRDLSRPWHRLERIQAIPGVSPHISIGYPITSHVRTIQGDFSPNPSFGANGISRRRHQGPTTAPIAKFRQCQKGVPMLPTRFWRNRQGSIAPLLGIAIIPLIAGVGAAVDYTPANAAHGDLQIALDSAALMLSKNRGVANERAASDRGDQHLQCAVYSDQRQESHGHRELFHDQRIAARALRHRDRQHEFYEYLWHRLDQHHRLLDIDLGQ